MKRPHCVHAPLLSVLIGFGMFGAVNASCAADAAPDIGMVLAVQGSPSVAVPSGRSSPLAIMDAIHDEETVALEKDERLVVCNEVLGFIFEISGPGKVRLTRAASKATDGSPRITTSGTCEVSPPADANGGVLLRMAPPVGNPR